MGKHEAAGKKGNLRIPGRKKPRNPEKFPGISLLQQKPEKPAPVRR
jgi:hypothetical protein